MEENKQNTTGEKKVVKVIKKIISPDGTVKKIIQTVPAGSVPATATVKKVVTSPTSTSAAPQATTTTKKIKKVIVKKIIKVVDGVKTVQVVKQPVEETTPIVQTAQATTTPTTPTVQTVQATTPSTPTPPTPPTPSTSTSTPSAPSTPVEENKGDDTKTPVVEEKPKKKSSKAGKIAAGILLPIGILGAAAYPTYLLVTTYVSFTTISASSSAAELVDNLKIDHKKDKDATVTMDLKTNLDENTSNAFHCPINWVIKVNDSVIINDDITLKTSTPTKIEFVIVSKCFKQLKSNVDISFESASIMVNPGILKAGTNPIKKLNEKNKFELVFSPEVEKDLNKLHLYDKDGKIIPEQRSETEVTQLEYQKSINDEGNYVITFSYQEWMSSDLKSITVDFEKE